MNIDTNIKKIGCFFLLLFFFAPPLFSVSTSFVTIDKFFDYIRLASFFGILIYALTKGEFVRFAALPILIITLFWTPQIIMTLKNDGNFTTSVNNYICMMAVCLIVCVGVKSNFESFLRIATLYFSALCLLNFATQILFPGGIVSEASMFEETYGKWILGGQNNMIAFIIPTMVLNGIRFMQDRKVINIIVILLLAVSAIISGSATGLLGMLLFLAMFFVGAFIKSEKTSAVFNINVYVVVGLIVLFMFVVIGRFSVFETIIVDFLKKDMTLTTRTEVWERTFAYIAQSPWLGCGVLRSEAVQQLLKASHQHNYFLHILFQGGIFALLFFVLLFNMCRRRLSINKANKECFVIAAGIFSFLIMFISEVYDGLLILPFCFMILLSLNYSARSKEKKDKEGE